jgi:hypothetical protein
MERLHQQTVICDKDSVQGCLTDMEGKYDQLPNPFR